MSKPQTNTLPMKIVEELTKGLDISDSMYNDAESKYLAVAKYLGESASPLLQDTIIYPQGSMKLGTVVKPSKKEEFDLDLVIHLPKVDSNHNSDLIHKLIGDRLKEEKSPYKDMCEPKNRCWTINYKNKFHLDITPAISNPFVDAEEFHYTDTAELVPDKKLQEWKDSNPKGFAKWFSDIAKKMPLFVIRKLKAFDMNVSMESILENYTIEDIPDNNEYKGLLRKTVQFLKKHRDHYFNDRNTNYYKHKPISIVITTLVAKSYRKIIEENREYSCPFEMMKDTVKLMSTFIKHDNQYKVLNPTNDNENFAEKWNDDIRYVKAFAIWQEAAYNALIELQEAKLHEIGSILEKSYGKDSCNNVLKSLSEKVNEDRENNILTTGIIASTSATNSVQANNFYGS